MQYAWRFRYNGGGFIALSHSMLHTTCREVMRLCIEHIAEPCALKIDGVFAGASITRLYRGLDRGLRANGKCDRIQCVCDDRVRVSAACVYPGSKSTVLEAYDIRSLGVIDTENRHGVQLDAPVILDSPLIYGLRREKGDSRRIRFSIRNGRRKLCASSRLFERYSNVP